MIDPSTLALAALVVSKGLKEYTHAKRVEVRREERGAYEAVQTVHLHNPEGLQRTLSPEALQALHDSADTGAYLVGDAR